MVMQKHPTVHLCLNKSVCCFETSGLLVSEILNSTTSGYDLNVLLKKLKA